MAQNVGGLYSALRLPWVYSALQSAIARGDARQFMVDNYIKPRPGERVIDIGCGPGTMAAYLGDVDYIGVDLDPNYIASARREYGSRGRFIQGDVSDVAVRVGEQADIVLAIALLHHLGDEQAHTLFAAAARLLKPGGRLITLDCVWVPHQNIIARMLIAADRGRNTRDQEQYRALAGRHFASIEIHLRDDLLRLPYNHCILLCRDPR